MRMDNSITQYLQQDHPLLGNVLSKLSQLEQWNSWLKECLPEQNKTLTQHCFIVNRAGASLIVIADNPHWVTRLRFHVPELLVKLKQYPGLETIQAICCKVQPNYVPVAPSKREPQQKLSPKNAALLRAAASKVKDKKLRMVLEKIAAHSE